jgi:cholesterol transport system auxiliary component
MKRLLLAALSMLTSCTLGPAPREAASVYDLGPPRAYARSEPRIDRSVLVQDVATPSWLDSTAMVYRLDYRDAGRQYIYANNRWASSPGALLTQKLRNRLAAASDGGIVEPRDNARADYALRVDLDDFSHVFGSAENSGGVVVARATLVDAARRTLAGQKAFAIEKAANGADAQAGVKALGAASEELVDAITAWVASTLGSAGNKAPSAASK